MAAKICFKCGKSKDIYEFYAHKEMADGHVNKCKDCNKKDVKGNYLDNIKKPGFIESERKRGRDKHKRLYSKAVRPYFKYEAGSLWADRFPEKVEASRKSQHLKRTTPETEKHHWSYNEEHFKDVIWMRKADHMRSHRFLVYDQEQKMYRRYDNNMLLDNKADHELFIRSCLNKFHY